MARKIWKWINDRWPLQSLLDLSLKEDIPGGARFTYSLGSSVLIVFIIQAVTGIWQLFYYVPTVEYAYNSLNYLRIDVPFGWLIHGLHYWGAQAMVVLVTFHMARVFLFGAYKKPRELTWLVGAVLLFLTLAMTFTGALLPWDMKGYFAAEVGTSIANTIPYVGEFIKKIMRGGEGMGQLTLSRFFISHVALIPGLIFLMIGIHLVSFRKAGLAGPWRKEKRSWKGPFWPDQVFKDAVVVTILFLVLVLLAVFVRAPLLGMADPLDTFYHPKPEWNFLFLYQALKAFKGKWEPVGTLGLPLLGFLYFFLLTLIDRRPERSPFKRPLAMLIFFFGCVAVILLTLAGNASHPGASGSSGTKTAAAKKAAAPSPQKALSSGGDISKGKALFHSNPCIGCHTIDGVGGKVGPDLSNEGQRGRSPAWITQQIRDPKSHFPNTVMPSFSGFSDQQVRDLVAYLESLGAGTSQAGAQKPSAASSPEAAKASPSGKTAQESQAQTGKTTPPPASPPALGQSARIIGDPAHGRQIFKAICQVCHGEEGKDKVPNPGSTDGTVPPLNPIDRKLYNSNPQVFVDHIDIFIQHGAVPAGPDPLHHMPDFGASHTLTQQQISQVEAYILKLNGVDRAKIIHPGVKPEIFVLIVVVVFVFSALVSGAVRTAGKKRSKDKKNEEVT
jgi:ubiquinol-cytochrome c reductase cytochrome b subunit